ncbi:hypothetical protein MHI39_20170 [Heyndrickxia sp. FSL K6-6286]|uniref:phage tail assembly chaperone n=1 Tax=Heyndrickxia sp. FSL K6-6286 TaxID=2921510 RepID=UPI0015D260D4|nr:hypothetical protein [Bacillus sp. Gen3]
MADLLQALLDAEMNEEKKVTIARFGDFIIKPVDGKTIGRLNQQATHGGTLDEQVFGGNLIATAVKNVDFNNEALKAKYSASDAGDCVQKALYAGEIAKLVKEIMDLSGFADFDKQVEEAKN